QSHGWDGFPSWAERSMTYRTTSSQVQHFLCTLYTNVQQKNNLVNTKEEVVGQAAFRYNNLVKSKYKGESYV
ncbi:MAG: hypothetical protein IJQ88_06225, partial [Clostridia bacterium]|nr:hypothetical protein [Clostridia bacterium]